MYMKYKIEYACDSNVLRIPVRKIKKNESLFECQINRRACNS